MSSLKHLLDNNRAWAAEVRARRARILSPPRGTAGPALPVDRLLGQPVPANEIVDLLPGELFRPPQRRQRRGPHGPQLPVGSSSTRSTCCASSHVIVVGHYGCGGQAGRVAGAAARADRQLAAGTCRTVAARHLPALRGAPRRRRARGTAVRAQRRRAGRARRAHDDRPGRLAPRPAADAARVDYGLSDGSSRISASRPIPRRASKRLRGGDPKPDLVSRSGNYLANKRTRTGH